MIFSASPIVAPRKVARVNPLAAWDRLVARLHGPALTSISRSSSGSAAAGDRPAFAGYCRNAQLEADLERLVEELERESLRLLHELDRALDSEMKVD